MDWSGLQEILKTDLVEMVLLAVVGALAIWLRSRGIRISKADRAIAFLEGAVNDLEMTGDERSRIDALAARLERLAGQPDAQRIVYAAMLQARRAAGTIDEVPDPVQAYFESVAKGQPPQADESTGGG